MKKNFFVLAAFCLVILAASCLVILAVTGPAAGSAGGSPAGAGSHTTVTTTRPGSGTGSPGDALMPPSVVRQGNTITISGHANGNPRPGVAIWVIGAKVPDTWSYANQFVVQPDSTGFYSRDIDSATASLQEGKYHVIVQHPGKNNVLDIYVDNNTAEGATNAWVRNRMVKENNNGDGTRVFKIHGAGSLQGDDAYQALIEGCKDSGVDDIIAVAPSPAATSTGSSTTAPATITRPGSGTGSPGDTLTLPLVARQGNKITISGHANGNPHPGVAIWVIGSPVSGTAGYANQFIVQPDSTGFYSLDLDNAAASLQEGRYHVIVQHPMKNNVLDIYLIDNTIDGEKNSWVWNRMLKENNDANGTRIFKILGSGSLQGDDAYGALIQAFEDPSIDDIMVIAH